MQSSVWFSLFVHLTTIFVPICGFLVSKSSKRQPTTYIEIVYEHTRICLHNTCHHQKNETSCCGFCTCDTNCEERGTCCPLMYSNFFHARESLETSRYGCVRAQYLSQENSDYSTGISFWMITKCDPEYQDQVEISKCLNPIHDLDSVVPVTEPPRLFKNKHCAYCNFVDKKAPLISWKRIQIQSDRYVSFPNSNLLQELQAIRGNLFFIPPEYIVTEACEPFPENMVDTCNVTGLWKNFEATVMTACESFVDPYNHTYKNIFCYMCNQGTQTSLTDICQASDLDRESRKPQFSATIDLDSVQNGNNPSILICDDDYIPDLYSKVCRRIFCHDNGVLFNAKCLISTSNINKTCFALSLNVLPFPDYPAQFIETFDKQTFIEHLHGMGLTPNDERPLVVFENSSRVTDAETILFFKTDKSDLIEYAVVYFVKQFKTSGDKREYLDRIVARPILEMEFKNEMFRRYTIQPALYNITITSEIANISIPIISDEFLDVNIDKLASDTRFTGTDICPQEETVAINKLHVCPYIKLRTDETVFDVQNGYLFIRGRNALGQEPARLFPQWEYDFDDGYISLCLQDYLDIYHDMARPNNLVSKSNSAKTMSNLSAAWFCILLLEIDI